MSVDTVETEAEKPVKAPTSFKDLKAEQLKAAALAFGADETQSAEAIRAELVELGVTWEMYEKAFLVPPAKPVEKESTVITSKDVNPPREEQPQVSEVITAEEHVPLAPSSKYLIRMTRKNPYFEFKNHRFTAENPYAIMNAEDAQAILSQEEGFRQAFPSELQEFYS